MDAIDVGARGALTFMDYQAGALRTAPKGRDERDERDNWLFGLAGEVGEYIELEKKFRYHGEVVRRERRLKELGDVLWYLTMTAVMDGFTLDEIAAANLAKLEARYPDGFSVDASLHRPSDG